MISISPLLDTIENREATFKWINSEDVRRGILRNEKTTWPEHENWFRRLRDDRKNIHFQILDDDCAFIGCISLKNIDWENGSGELMIYIGDAENRGKHFGYRAIKLFIEHTCFLYFNMRKIYVTVSAENIIARHLYKRCGFIEEGVFKDAFFQDGKYIDVIKMVRISDE